MKIVEYIKIFYWYFKNYRFLPNLFFLINNKIKKIIFKQAKRKIDKKNLKFLKHREFYKLNKINEKNFKKIKLYNTIIKDKKKLISNYGGAADLNLIFSLCNKVNSKFFFFLETGVALGWSSLVFLYFLKKKRGKLISIDLPYSGKTNFDYVGTVVPNNFRNKWNLIRSPDIIALRKIKRLGRKFDLIHYDSDKSYYGRKKSYEILWPLLKKGGFFISDDICDNYAFLDFVKKHKFIENKNYFILKYIQKYIGIILKK